MKRRGRPTQFEHQRQLSLIIPAEEYNIIQQILRERRQIKPGYALAEVVRPWISYGLRQYDRKTEAYKQQRKRRIEQIKSLAYEIRTSEDSVVERKARQLAALVMQN